VVGVLFLRWCCARAFADLRYRVVETGFQTVMLLDWGVDYEPEGRSKATVREEKKGKEKMGIAAATPLFDIVTPLPKYMMIKYLLLSNKTCYQDSLAFVANLDNIQ
jgi:hypothetical protein